MWRSVFPLAATLCLTSAVSAHADALCRALAERDASLGDPSSTCRISLLQGGGEQQSCYWTYDYRDAASSDHLEELRINIEKCLGRDAALAPDTQVNHPDSFDLFQYEGQGIRAALSLKDKAGLGKSLVFLSLSRVP